MTSNRFTAVEIAAAQLRVELDESLGRTTPEPIREAAQFYDWTIHPREPEPEPWLEREPEPEPEPEPWLEREPGPEWEIGDDR